MRRGKGFLKEKQGFVSVFVLLTGTLLILITLSLITRQVNEVKAVNSFESRIQAHYLAESYMDMVLWQVNDWCDEAIESYGEGVQLAAETGAVAPSLKEYVHSHVIQLLHQLNEYKETPLKNPFEGLEKDHGILVKASVSPFEKELIVVVQGLCERTRATQKVTLQLPRVTAVHSLEQEGGFGNEVVIEGMLLLSRFQTSSEWY